MDNGTGQAVRVVLFDFEGTLVDFCWDLKGAIRQAQEELARLGYPRSCFVDHYALLKNNAVLSASQHGLTKTAVAQHIDQIYDRYDLLALSRWKLQPDVKPLLSYLKDVQIRTGLVTNVGRLAIEQALERLGLVGLFDTTVTRNDVELMKPSGEGIRRALERLGGKNSAALFVGDSVSDILAAKDAGVRVAIVHGGESDSNSLAAAFPTYQWRSVGELQTLYRKTEG